MAVVTIDGNVPTRTLAAIKEMDKTRAAFFVAMSGVTDRKVGTQLGFYCEEFLPALHRGAHVFDTPSMDLFLSNSQAW